MRNRRPGMAIKTHCLSQIGHAGAPAPTCPLQTRCSVKYLFGSIITVDVLRREDANP